MHLLFAWIHMLIKSKVKSWVKDQEAAQLLVLVVRPSSGPLPARCVTATAVYASLPFATNSRRCSQSATTKWPKQRSL
jgi:hypothetical protein